SGAAVEQAVGGLVGEGAVAAEGEEADVAGEVGEGFVLAAVGEYLADVVDDDGGVGLVVGGGGVVEEVAGLVDAVAVGAEEDFLRAGGVVGEGDGFGADDDAGVVELPGGKSGAG